MEEFKETNCDKKEKMKEAKEIKPEKGGDERIQRHLIWIKWRSWKRLNEREKLAKVWSDQIQEEERHGRVQRNQMWEKRNERGQRD